MVLSQQHTDERKEEEEEKKKHEQREREMWIETRMNIRMKIVAVTTNLLQRIVRPGKCSIYRMDFQLKFSTINKQIHSASNWFLC